MTASGWEPRLVDFIDRRFASIHRRYERWLHGSLNYLPVTAVFALIVLGSIYFLYSSATSELAPQEDQGVIIAIGTAAPNATLAAAPVVSTSRCLTSSKAFRKPTTCSSSTCPVRTSPAWC